MGIFNCRGVNFKLVCLRLVFVSYFEVAVNSKVIIHCLCGTVKFEEKWPAIRSDDFCRWQSVEFLSLKAKE